MQWRFFVLLISLGLANTWSVRAGDVRPQTENLFWVMLDGLRWQEVYYGAEASLLNKERGGVQNVPVLRKQFVRDTLDEQRAALLPFLWGTVARQGQLYGNRDQGSVVRVTNGQNFSYPGYSEVLCGYADPSIDSNDKIPNRNRTVLEWLHARPELKGKIAAFTAWDVFPYIINAQRSGILVNAGHMPLTGIGETAEIKMLNRLIAEAPLFDQNTRSDALTFQAALLYVQSRKPRVLFLSFDETDTQAHEGRYDRVLGSAHKADGFLRELWETAQRMPEYSGKTTLIITTDHGRGDPPVEWKNHNAKTPGSEFIWIGILGPDTPALGERRNTRELTQSQVAATAAALLGYDYAAAVPQAGKRIEEAIRKRAVED